MKKTLIALTLAASTFAATAQPADDSPTTTPEATSETATTQTDTPTTEPTITYARTTASIELTSNALAARNRNTSAMLEQRWQAEEKIYREVGLAEEKIQKLKAITDELYSKQSTGARFDYMEMRKRRMEILTEEDMQKLRELSRKQLSNRTTTTRQAKTTTTE